MRICRYEQEREDPGGAGDRDRLETLITVRLQTNGTDVDLLPVGLPDSRR